MDHDEPFQESANVDRLVPAPDCPTALQNCLAETGNAASSESLGARRRVGARRDGELLSRSTISMKVADGGPDPGLL